MVDVEPLARNSSLLFASSSETFLRHALGKSRWCLAGSPLDSDRGIREVGVRLDMLSQSVGASKGSRLAFWLSFLSPQAKPKARAGGVAVRASAHGKKGARREANRMLLKALTDSMS